VLMTFPSKPIFIFCNVKIVMIADYDYHYRITLMQSPVQALV
jgi:hypothetical protein